MSLSVDGVWKAGVWAQTVWGDGVWREGDYVPPVTNYVPGSGGVYVTPEGAVFTAPVSESFSGAAGDTFIEGTRFRSDGAMYITSNTPTVDTTYVSGVLHTSNGVRYVLNSEPTNRIHVGFATGSLGRQCVTTVVAGSFLEGVRRSDSGRMVVTSV